VYYFLEMWTPGEGWSSLSEAEQEEWVRRAGEDIQGLLDEGVELVAIGKNDVDADRQSEHAYWAVWSMPNEELLEEFQEAVREAGVYELLDQVNLCGRGGDPVGVLGDMIGA